MKAAIIGGTGYTGSELLRLSVGHPELEVVAGGVQSAGRSHDYNPLIHTIESTDNLWL